MTQNTRESWIITDPDTGQVLYDPAVPLNERTGLSPIWTCIANTESKCSPKTPHFHYRCGYIDGDTRKFYGIPDLPE